MRRQPKQTCSQERVHHILDVAEQLFIELGYEQTSTRAIATRAGVPVGLLYQFFLTKKR
ncbi:helix-turn-helix domain-containing protein [Nostoc sp. CMAA1605]|uniref:helix-turn-helix domain-containing protein n=1 Tax=Nostoc sp. CMAA1605 TaxID=2055159 RepID=UPI002E300C68|nr:helix-turn-helix domain-containing protein [Nostoc sp. CMAA1605]